NQTILNQFQTLNASANHVYKIGQQRASTSLVYTKFFNSSSDTGFIYYNSTNLFANHSLMFNRVTTGVSISHSYKPGYRFDVMEENFSFQVSKRGSVGAGVKIFDLNQTETRLGGYLHCSVRIGKADMLSVHAENGYIPGTNNRLVNNTTGTINFIKNIP
ncbi:MAG: hypothetical protein ABUT20_59100, partial [Bacteroidota bacterium]